MIQFIVLLVVCGVVWYFLQDKIAEPFRQIIVVVVVLFFCLWLLCLFGIYCPPFSLPHGR